MGLFKPRSANEKNYLQYEVDLYIALEVLKKVAQEGEKEDKCYVIDSLDKSYKKAFNLSYGLVKFYSKHLEGNNAFKFKKNFLLSKTRGLFSVQDRGNTKALGDFYLVKTEQLDNLPGEYFRMFKLEKYFDKTEEEKK